MQPISRSLSFTLPCLYLLACDRFCFSAQAKPEPPVISAPQEQSLREKLRFEEIGANRRGSWPGFPDELRGRYAKGIFLIHEDKEDGAVVWKGPIADASFTVETTAASRTLKDKQGRVLWSDARTQPIPDLAVYKEVSGQARIVDKNQKVLWTGTLSTALDNRRSEWSGSAVHIAKSGLRIDGERGAFTVKNSAGDVLWTGQLPLEPVILLRDNNEAGFYTSNRLEVSDDGIDTIVFAGETGTATLRTPGGQNLGTQSVDILTVKHTRKSKGKKPQDWPLEYKVPTPELNGLGELSLAYKDKAGQTVAQYTVYKTGNRSGFSGRVVK